MGKITACLCAVGNDSIRVKKNGDSVILGYNVFHTSRRVEEQIVVRGWELQEKPSHGGAYWHKCYSSAITSCPSGHIIQLYYQECKCKTS